MNIARATCAMSTLYSRVSRYRDRMKEASKIALADYDVDDGNNVAGVDDGGGKAGADDAAPLEGGVLTPRPRAGGLAALGLAAAVVESTLAGLPAWIDPMISGKMMTRRKRKSLTEAHSYRLTEQVSNLYRDGRYKSAFKACTALLQPTMASEDSSRGRRVTAKKRTVSIRKARDRINAEMLSSPNDRKLKRSTIFDAVQRGEFGVSPMKKGRPSTIPPELTHGLACHAVMMQSSGEGEASSIKMRAIGGALTLGTPHENKFSIEYLWRQTRIRHPKMIMPAKAINNEDRRVDWLTYHNIMDWNKKAKAFLISCGMCTEERGLIRKLFVCLNYSTTE